jgi:DNA-binding XRE family transcriptional regulator
MVNENLGWFKIHCGYNLEILLEKRPKCFLLLTQIAMRARWNLEEISICGLEIGEAMIGDYANCGLSEREYRTALGQLVKMGIVTTRTTNKGTIAKLVNTSIFDPFFNSDNQQGNQPTISTYQTSTKDQKKMTAILKRIKELGMTQRQVAQQMGLTAQQINMYCRGLTPGYKRAKDLADFLDSTIPKLFPDGMFTTRVTAEEIEQRRAAE